MTGGEVMFSQDQLRRIGRNYVMVEEAWWRALQIYKHAPTLEELAETAEISITRLRRIRLEMIAAGYPDVLA